MAEKSQVLKSYEIEITAKIDKAEQQIKTLQERIDRIMEGSGKSKNSAIAQSVAEQFNKIDKAITEMSKSTQTQIDNLNKSFGELGVKKLEKKYLELSNSLDAALGRVSGDMLDLRNVIDKTDSGNFSNFINELKVPLENLTVAISDATAEFKKLPEALNGLKGIDTLLSNVSKTEEDVTNKGQRLVELLDELNSMGKSFSKGKSKNILGLFENGLDDLDLSSLNQLQNAIAAIEDEIRRLKNDGVNVSDILFENSIISKNTLNKIKTSVNQAISDITGEGSKVTRKLSDAELSITIHPDFDEKEVATFLESVQKKLNEHADKYPIKIPLGYKIDTSGLDEETAKEVNEKAAKSLKSGLLVGMRANQDNLLQSTKEAIAFVNKELNVYDNAIEVKIKPIDIDKSALNNINLDVEKKVADEVIVKSQDGLSISDTGNLATEDTLSSIRDILLGVKTEIKSDNGSNNGGISTSSVDNESISDQIVHGRLRTRQFSLNPTNYASDVAEVAGDLMNELSELYQINDDLKTEIGALKRKKSFDEVKKTSLYSASSIGGDGRIYSTFNKGQLLETSQKGMEIAFKNYSEKIDETTKRINEKYSNALKDEENSWKRYATEQLTYNYEYGKSKSSETGLRQDTTNWIKSTSEFSQNLRQAQLDIGDDFKNSKNSIKTAKTKFTKTINKLIKDGKIGEDIAETFKESYKAYIDFFQHQDVTALDTEENYEIKNAKQKFLEAIALANHTTVDSEMQKSISEFESAVNNKKDTVKGRVDVNKIVQKTYDQIYRNNLKLIENATSIDTDINYKQLSKDKDGKIKQTTLKSLFNEAKGKETKNSIESIIEPLTHRQNNVEKEIKDVADKLALNNISVKKGTTNINASDLSALNTQEVADSVFKQVDAINQKYKQRIDENEREQAYLLREKQICDELLALHNDELSVTISEEEKQERINALLTETKELKSGSLNSADYVDSKSASKVIDEINSISSAFKTAKTPRAVATLQTQLAKAESKLKALAIKDIDDISSYANNRLDEIGKPYSEVKSQFTQLVLSKKIPDKYNPDAMSDAAKEKLRKQLIKKAGIGELASLQRETLMLGSQANKEKNALVISSQSGIDGGGGEQDITTAIKSQKEYNNSVSELISLKQKLSDIESKIRYTDEWSIFQDLANKYAKGVKFTEDEAIQYERLRKKSERRGLDPVSKNKQDYSLLTPEEKSFYKKNTKNNNRVSSLTKQIALYEKTNNVENPYFKDDSGAVKQAKNLNQIGIYSKKATEAYNNLYLATDKNLSITDKIEKYNAIVKDTDATIQSLGINGKETGDYISVATKRLDEEIAVLKDELAKQEDLKIKNRDNGKSTSKQEARIAELKESISLKSGKVLDSDELIEANSKLKETENLITLLISDIVLASGKSEDFIEDFKNIQINYNKSKSDFNEVKQIFENNFAEAWQRNVGQWKPGQFSKQQISEFEKELRYQEKQAIGYYEAEQVYRSDYKKYFQNNNILADAGKYSLPLQKALEQRERLEQKIDYLQGEQNKKATIRNGLINLYAEQIEKEYSVVTKTNAEAKEQIKLLKEEKRIKKEAVKAEDERLNYDVKSARTKENRSYNGKTAVTKGRIKSLNSEIENIQAKIEKNLEIKEEEVAKQTILAMDKILPILAEKSPDSLQLNLDYSSAISEVERYNNELYSGSNRPPEKILIEQIDELYRAELEKNSEYQEIKQQLSSSLTTISNLTKDRKAHTTTKSAKKDAKTVRQTRSDLEKLITRRDELETTIYNNSKSSILSKWDTAPAENLINLETQYLVLTDKELKQQEQLISVGQISLSEHQQNIIAINNENEALKEQLRTLKKQKEEKESQLAIANSEHLQNLANLAEIEKYQQDKIKVAETIKKRQKTLASKEELTANYVPDKKEKFTVNDFNSLIKDGKVEDATKSLSKYISNVKKNIAELEKTLASYQHELTEDSAQNKFIKALEQEGALSDDASESLKQTYALAKKALDDITNKVKPLITSIDSKIEGKRNEIRALQSAEQNYYEKNTRKASRKETDLEKIRKEKTKQSADESKYIKYAGMTEEEVALSKQIGVLAGKLNHQKQKGLEYDEQDLATYNKLVNTAKEIYGLTVKTPKSEGWFTGVRSKYSKDEVLANKAKFNTNSETAKALGLSSISNLSASSEGVVINATKSGLALNSTVREIVDILKNSKLKSSNSKFKYNQNSKSSYSKKDNKLKQKYNSDEKFLQYAYLNEEQAQVKKELNSLIAKMISQKKKEGKYSEEDLAIYKKLRQEASDKGLQLKNEQKGRLAGAYKYGFDYDKKNEVLANKSKYATNSIAKDLLNDGSNKVSKKNINAISKETDALKENTTAKKENVKINDDLTETSREVEIESLSSDLAEIKDVVQVLSESMNGLQKVRDALKELGAFDSNFKTVDEYIKASNLSMEELVSSISKITGLNVEDVSGVFETFDDIFVEDNISEKIKNTISNIENIEKETDALKENTTAKKENVEINDQQTVSTGAEIDSKIPIKTQEDSIISDAKKVDEALSQLGKEEKQSIKDFISSIGESEDDLIAEISMFANIPEDIVRDLLGIHSPSIVMQQLGYWTGKGFAGGINKSEDDVKQAVDSLMSAFKADAKSQSKSLEEYLQDVFAEVWSNAPTVTRGQLGGKALRQIFEDNGLLEAKSSANSESSSVAKGESAETKAQKKEVTEVKKLKDAYSELTKVYKTYYKALTKSPDEYKEIDKKAIAKYNRSKDIVDALKDTYSNNESVRKAFERYSETKAKVESDFETKQDNSLTKQLSKLKLLLDENKYVSKYISRVEALIGDISALQENGFDLTNPEDQKKLKDLRDKYLGIINLQNEQGNLKGKSVSIEKLEGDLVKLKKYTALPKDIREEIDKLYDSLLKLKNTDDYSIKDIANFAAKIENIKNEVENSGKKAVSFVDQVKQRLRDMNSKYIAQFFSFQDWIRYGREMLNIIIDIDSAMTELRKVSNATEKELSGALAQATSTAKELGANISDIVSLQADWSRLGYSVEEAEELARVTQLYVNVGDNLTTDTASEYMISTLQGFNIEAKNAIEIVDKFNEVANNFAIDTEGLGDALERSAASFTASGTSLSEAIAIVTTANTVVQDSEKVGTAMKTLSARIRGASTDLEDLGEEEDEYTKSTSKLRAEVKGLTGFDIMEDENTYKSIYEILLGIGKEWDNLTDIEQASLGEALAGKQNSNVFYSIMQNIDELEDVYKTAEDAAGSAEKEELNFEKSIQYSLSRIQASAQEWANNLISSDIIKWFVDLGNAIVNVSTKFGSLTTVIAGAGIFAGVKNFKDIKTSIESYASVMDIFSINGVDSGVKNLNGLNANSITALANSLKGLSEQQANLVLSTTKLDAESKNYLLTCAGLKATNIEQIAQTGNLTKSILTNALARTIADEKEVSGLITKMAEAGVINTLEDGTVELTKATLEQAIAESTLSAVDKDRVANALLQQTANEGLTASYLKLAGAQLKAMALNPATLIMGAVAVGVIATKVFDHFNLSVEEATENSNSFLESAKSLNSEITSNSSSISELNERYQELSKGVSSTGENMSLTTSEYEEYKGLVSQISELLPNLNTFFDEQGNKIGFVAGNLSDLNEEYTKYAQQKTWEELNTKDDEGHTVSESNAKTYDDYINGGSKGKLLKALQNSKRDDILSKVTDTDEGMLNLTTYNLASVTDYTQSELRDIFFESGADAIYGILDEAVSTLEKEGESAFAPLREEISDWIFVDDGYTELSDDAKKGLSDFVSSLDAELYNKINSDGLSAKEFAKKWVTQFSDDKTFREAWTNLSSLDLSDVKFGDIDSTLKEKAKVIFEAIGLDWDNGGYELLVNLNLIPDDTNYNALKEMLGDNSKLADKLTLDQIDTLTSDDFKKWLEEAEINLEDFTKTASDDSWAKKLTNAYKIAQRGTKNLSDSLSSITTKIDNFGSLGDIYEDVQDGGEFDYSSIADTDGDFYKIFGNLGQAYEDFIQTIANSPSDISACQRDFDNLATTWVYANGVLDDLDNTNKQATANMLKQNGVQNATEMVNAYIAAANTYTEAYNSLGGATDYAISLADATWEDVEAMSEVPDVTQDAADAMYIYYIQKLMASSGFTSANDIQELASVIKALQIAGTAWGKYYSARANYQALSNASVGDTVSLVNLKTGDAYEKTIESQKQLNHYLEYQNNIMNSNKTEGLDQMSAKVGNLGAKVKKTADDTSSDAQDKADEIEDAYENLLDAEITVLEKQLDAQLITYGDYLDKRFALLEDYHNKGLISEQKYYEALADTYQSEIDNYDKVVSAVDKVIDDRIDALEDQKEALEKANDAQVKELEDQQDALEKQKEAIEDQQDAIEKQIDALEDQKEELEDQKEALEDANKAREDAVELQKALYDLEKAQTQRTRLVYSDGQMVYKSDASSIRDAQDNLDDITYDKKVQEIDDAIDAIDDKIDEFNDKIDELDDEIDKLDDRIDELDDEIDKINDAFDLQTDAIDNQIDALNKYKDKWDEVANAWQDAQNIAVANQVLGDNWQDQVLALDTAPIENFKNAYVGAQDQMALANEMAAEAAVAAAQEELAAAQSASSGTQSAVAGATNSLAGIIDILSDEGSDSTSKKTISKFATDEQNFNTGKVVEKKPSQGGSLKSQTTKATTVTGAANDASDAVDDMNNSISDTSKVVPGVQSSLNALISTVNNEPGAYIKSTSAIKANTEARLGNIAAMENEAKADRLRQKINSRGYSITTPNQTAYVTGSSGLKSAQEALTSEYGQAEMIVTPDGHWQVTTEPTLQKLPRGTVIYDNEQTEQILKGKAYSTGTGATISPLAEADSAKYKMFSNVSAMLVNTNSISVGLKDISKSLAQISAEVTPRAQNNNVAQQVTFGNITVNCPGVTEAEVAKNLPNALQNAFSGLALNAYQQSMKR